MLAQLRFAPAIEEPRKSSLQIQESSPVVRPEPVRRRRDGRGPSQAMARSMSFPCPKVQEAKSRE